MEGVIDAIGAVRDAIAHQEAEERRARAWQAAIRTGLDQLERGDMAPYDADLRMEIMRAAVATVHADRPIDPDVLP